jgi:hypothetical protein
VNTTANAEATPSEAQTDATKIENSFESIYNQLLDDGIWLEQQAHADKGIYKNCPLCQQIADSFSKLAELLGAHIQQADEVIDGCTDPESLDSAKLYWATLLMLDKQWLEAAKAQLVAMFQAGHDYGVFKCHPDIRPKPKPSSTKVHLNKEQRKTKRKARRAARKRGRA